MVTRSTAPGSAVSTDEKAEDALASGKTGESDEVSSFSRPGLCFEDTDSDEEYSMYDYSDDFSTPNDDPQGDLHDEEDQHSSEEDPSAIEFELAITFQGRKYNATRAFPTFVKLRDDLLREFNDGDEGETKYGLHYRRSKRVGGGTKSPINVENECAKTIPGENANSRAMAKESVSVPELPRVSPESLGHGGYALSGVARSGFALLQATAQHYCPEMEHWMRQVIDTFPCSQSLSSFLWEPLSSHNVGWETIGEGAELNEKNNSLSDMSSSAKKPSMHTRSKPRSSTFSKSRLTKSKRYGSMGSLNSIDEGNDCDNDWDDHST